MCGICGIVKSGAPVTEPEIRAMREVLAHRGPDSAGQLVQGRVGLGHRRLSIIDLSQAGSQPMLNETGTISLVFNGEIYNFQDLQRYLEKKGHNFRSQSDSEVIVHAYEEFGVECLHHFRGMFAFALWDNDRQRLFAARDRLGKKPFFYCLHKGDFYFGSEIKAILAAPQIPRELDWESLGFFLSLNYTPAPYTLFARHPPIGAGPIPPLGSRAADHQRILESGLSSRSSRGGIQNRYCPSLRRCWTMPSGCDSSPMSRLALF